MFFSYLFVVIVLPVSSREPIFFRNTIAKVDIIFETTKQNSRKFYQQIGDQEGKKSRSRFLYTLFLVLTFLYLLYFEINP